MRRLEELLRQLCAAAKAIGNRFALAEIDFLLTQANFLVSSKQSLLKASTRSNGTLCLLFLYTCEVNGSFSLLGKFQPTEPGKTSRSLTQNSHFLCTFFSVLLIFMLLS